MALPSGELRPSLWSDLPAELAGLVLRRFPLSHSDRFSFMAVCRQWRLAAQRHGPLPPALPWLCVAYDRTFRSLPGGEVRCFTGWGGCSPSKADRSCSFGGWLLCERHDAGRTCFLTNPFTGATVDVPRRMDFNGIPADRGFSVGTLMRKMVVCSPDLVAASLQGTAVGFYRPGDPSWSVSKTSSNGCWYRDIAFHHGKLYALTADEELFSYEIVDGDIDEPKYEIASPETDPATEPDEVPSKMHYLVTSCDGRLLMVRWSVPRREGPAKVIDAIKLKVFEADLDMGEWLEVEDDGLDGQALFVSQGCYKAILLPGHDDQRFQGDRVYFLGDDLIGQTLQ